MLISANTVYELLFPIIYSYTYEGHPINRGNFLIMQEFVPFKHHKYNHNLAKLVAHATTNPKV